MKIAMFLSRVFLNVFLVLFFCQSVFGDGDKFEWQKASPQSQGFSSEKLDKLKDILIKNRTKTFVIIRNDKIVYEWFADNFGPRGIWCTASLAKAVVGGMSLAVAMNDGLISPDDLACKYVPQWKGHPQKSKITIRHLATHSSGLDDAEHSRDGWMKEFWKTGNPFLVARDKTPMIFEPGTDYQYSNPGMAMLAYAVAASIKDSPQSDIRSLLKKRVMDPIGVPEGEWNMGYNKKLKVDGLNLVANWGGGAYTAWASARVGRLMLRKGNWDGVQLINAKVIEDMVKYAGTPIFDRSKDAAWPGSGLCWYTNFDGVWQTVPRDAFAGAGAGNQFLLVVPSLDLIVVRLGNDMYDKSKGEAFWVALEEKLLNPLMDSFIEAPYPASEFITKVEFAPISDLIRKACGSDNWPITWADDDNQYTAYGDGWGFEPKVEKKLSLGIAKVVGFPPDFQGVNIRTASGERIGQGKEGAKASGMLMVDGVLYMLARNTGNSQLAWSADYGKKWEWSEWKFTESFGYPTFLNFGKNYAGARDNYVYIYSHDSDSAYLPGDRMVLARVHKKRIKDRRAYEFFKGLDCCGKPIWTKDIKKRGAVFEHPARCYRSGIVYNAGLKRYLWCQVIPGGDTRAEGGFGIYESSQPWGPWRTVFFTRKWDIGPGETSSIPAKWISADGKTCYLLFSGDDCFSVRQIGFTVKK